ncbi:MAG: metallophosphoesterase family protein [Bacillota bacterium]|jgi:putative phosphoesterase|nr:metallophosphoesterase [Bacillota bacterium]
MLLAFGDSHRYPIVLEEIEAILRRQKPSLFVHTGDNYADFLRLLKKTKIPGYGVRGNCDRGVSAPEELLFDFHDFKIYLTHGHQYGAKHSTRQLVERAFELGAQGVIFGHSHVPLVREERGILLVNPGSISLPRRGSDSCYAKVYVKNNQLLGEIHKATL